MTPESSKRLRDSSLVCSEIATFLRGQSRASFVDDRMLHHAVSYALVVLGEALSVLRRGESDLAEGIPDLHRFVALRNHLVHGYDAIDMDIIARVAFEEVPRCGNVVSSPLIDDLGGTR